MADLDIALGTLRTLACSSGVSTQQAQALMQVAEEVERLTRQGVDDLRLASEAGLERLATIVRLRQSNAALGVKGA